MTRGEGFSLHYPHFFDFERFDTYPVINLEQSHILFVATLFGDRYVVRLTDTQVNSMTQKLPQGAYTVVQLTFIEKIKQELPELFVRALSFKLSFVDCFTFSG